jgi:hypothetical protein
MTEDEIKKDSRIGDPMQELVIQQGELFGVVVKRVFKYERWLLILAASFLTVNLLVIWTVQKTELKLTAVTIALGVITNLITAGITLFATNLRRR